MSEREGRQESLEGGQHRPSTGLPGALPMPPRPGPAQALPRALENASLGLPEDTYPDPPPTPKVIPQIFEHYPHTEARGK